MAGPRKLPGMVAMERKGRERVCRWADADGQMQMGRCRWADADGQIYIPYIKYFNKCQ